MPGGLKCHGLSRPCPALTSHSLGTWLGHGEGGGTKYQPEWVSLFVSLIRRRVSNIEFRYVARLPWTLEALKTRQAVSIIAEAWCATKPLLDFVRDTPSA